ncbi:MAG: hypothetical protein R6X02_32030 [Enhygromyxa sp.]
MSNTLSAALRHLRDAEHLLSCQERRSSDQAYHLAGFAPECARKACLAERWADKELGHDFGDHAESCLALLTSIDLQSLRYQSRGWEEQYPKLGQWKVGCRYEPTGTFDEERARALIDEARCATLDICVALWADGLVTPEVIKHDLL